MKINMKKFILACLAVPMLAQIAIAELSCEKQIENFDCQYEFNESYCEEIYWEDARNCVAPEQIVTRKFCESIAFPDTKAVCFTQLAEQDEDAEDWRAEDCEDMGYVSRIEMCLEYVEGRKN